MKIRKYLLTGTITLCAWLMYAQTPEDQRVFGAMQDELDRNMKLKLDGAASPFIISYYYLQTSEFQMAGKLGAIVNCSEVPVKAWGGVDVLVGNYDETSETGFGGRIAAFEMPLNADYEVMRQKYWLYTDRAYKEAIMKKGMKKTADEMLEQHEVELKDLLPVEPVTKILSLDEKYTFNKEEWIKKTEELSAVFKEFPQLYGSEVIVSGKICNMYMKTSEGITLKRPFCSVTVSAFINGRTKDGVKLREHYSVSAKRPQDLPAIEDIKQQLTQFAKGLMVYKEAELHKVYYRGPVLFEGGGAAYFFNKIFQTAITPTARGGWVDYREELPLEERFGKKITDTRLTIKNYTDLKEYKGKKLTGFYEIDAEGVVPAKELMLVENGLLRNQLNNRFPRRNFNKNTGSWRVMPQRGTIGGFFFHHSILPGTLHFSVHKGNSPEKLKKELIRAAKEEGFEFAYILRKVGVTTRIYRVDVKTGEEVSERNVELPMHFEIGKYRILDFSNKEIVSNMVAGEHYSMIYPSGVLIESFPLWPVEEKNGAKPVLPYPFEHIGK